MRMTISATDPHPRQRSRILDTEISYVDVGYGVVSRLKAFALVFS
jgi:hypothetical protein